VTNYWLPRKRFGWGPHQNLQGWLFLIGWTAMQRAVAVVGFAVRFNLVSLWWDGWLPLGHMIRFSCDTPVTRSADFLKPDSRRSDCRGRGSNPHDPFGSQDFRSVKLCARSLEDPPPLLTSTGQARVPRLAHGQNPTISRWPGIESAIGTVTHPRRKIRYIHMRAAVVTVAVVVGFSGPMSAQQDQTIYRPGNGVSTPRLIKDVKPGYTAGAMRRKVSGAVLLRCVVDRDGMPTRVRIIDALDEELDRVSLNALKQWRFEPGRKDGEIVLVQIDVVMTFSTPTDNSKEKKKSPWRLFKFGW
jgi:TonB family protein